MYMCTDIYIYIYIYIYVCVCAHNTQTYAPAILMHNMHVALHSLRPIQLIYIYIHESRANTSAILMHNVYVALSGLKQIQLTNEIIICLLFGRLWICIPRKITSLSGWRVIFRNFSITYALIYVDDILLIGNDQDSRNATIRS